MKIKKFIPLTAFATLASTTTLPGAEYEIDPMHSSLRFSVSHLGISNVQGQFDKFSGSITVEDGKVTAIQGTAEVKSINTGVNDRDDHLRSPDFFDAENHPTITFKTKSIETVDGVTTFVADFTMRGVTKEVSATINISDEVVDPFGTTRIGLQTNAKLNRKDYGFSFNAALETGISVVGEEVSLIINVEAIKP